MARLSPDSTDTCCLSCVFKPQNATHAEFRPVLEWVLRGKGRMIYGGTKYKNELGLVTSLIPVLSELERAGRIVLLPDEDVNFEEQRVEKLAEGKGFDDAHLVAIVIVSGCQVVCTNDGGAERCLKRRVFYPHGLRKPKIYKRSSHCNLLCDTNIVSICRN